MAAGRRTVTWAPEAMRAGRVKSAPAAPSLHQRWSPHCGSAGGALTCVEAARTPPHERSGLVNRPRIAAGRCPSWPSPTPVPSAADSRAGSLRCGLWTPGTSTWPSCSPAAHCNGAKCLRGTEATPEPWIIRRPCGRSRSGAGRTFPLFFVAPAVSGGASGLRRSATVRERGETSPSPLVGEGLGRGIT